MVRVTRPGGIVAGLNEGIRGIGRSADNPDQAGEKELGINEHVHTRLVVPERVHRARARPFVGSSGRMDGRRCRSAFPLAGVPKSG